MATLLATSLLSGCATIVGDNSQALPISSTPSNASVLITDEKGKQVFKGTTPTSVSLQKSDGSYFGGKSFTVQIDKEGYATQVISVKARANGWYIAGNLVFGGLIGWLIIDPFNGGMYKLSPDTVSSSLNVDGTSLNYGSSDGGIVLVLLEDVPENLRDKMQRLN